MNTQSDVRRTHSSRRERILRTLWRNLPRIVLLLVILMIFALMSVISGEKKRLIQEKAATQAQEAKPINTVLLELKPAAIQDSINLPGIIEPWTRLELMAKIGGSISEILVQEGSVVETGQVLARIEPDDYRISLDSAKASYSLARAQHERGKLMLQQRTMPQAELDKLEAQMQTARAAMEEAELMLSRCSITAPMNGVIRRLDAKVGLLLSVGDPIAEILQIDRVKALVGIPETDVNSIRNISEVDITIQALDDRQVTGRKYFLASSPETTARLYRLELELENPGGDILPGMFFRAQVIKRTVADALTVPLYSVITRNNDQFVFVARDGVAHKTEVKLGIVDKWQVEITQGLEAGDQVVVEGHRDVEDGQQIKVIHILTDPRELTL